MSSLIIVMNDDNDDDDDMYTIVQLRLHVLGLREWI